MFPAAQAYAGIPLQGSDGQTLGALCVVDTRPRAWDLEQLHLVADLATTAVAGVAERQSRQAAAVERVRLSRLVQDVDAIVWEADPRTWRFTFVSEQAEALLGYPCARWLEEPDFWINLIHPEDRESAVHTCTTATAAGQDHEFDYRAVAADGRIVWLRDRVRVLLDAEGRPENLVGFMVDITTQKLAEEQLQHVISSAQCLLWEASVEEREGTLHWEHHVPDEAAALCFLPLTLRPGQSYVEAWKESRLAEDLSRIRTSSERACREGRSRYIQEYRCRRADGAVRWLFEDVKVERQGEGRWRAVGVCSDITERKEAELALAERERRFRALIENASDVITILDADGFIVYESPSIRRVLGYNPEELVGTQAFALIHEAEREALLALFHRVLYESEPRPSLSYPYRFRAKDGTWRWFESTATNLLHDPIIRGVVLNSRDVSERMAVETALRESEAQYRRIIETTTEGVWMIDAEARTTFVNPQMAQMLGYTPDELLGRRPTEFILEEDRAEAEVRWAQRREGRAERYDARCLRKDGSEVWLLVSATSRRSETGAFLGSLAMVTDITERKRAEMQLRYVTTHANCILWFADIQEIGAEFPDWRIHLTDPEGAQRFFPLEIAPGQRYGQAWYESRLDGDREQSDRIGAAAVRAGRSFSQEFRCRNRYGEVRWLREDVQIETVGPGQWRAVGVTTDVTERKQVELALIESEARLRQIFECGMLGLLYWNAEGQITQANDTLLRMLGYSRAELEAGAIAWTDLTPPEYAHLDERGLAEIQVCGVCTPFEKEYFRKDGSRVPIFIGGARLPGTHEGVAFVLDITERKKAEERKAAFQALGRLLNTATTSEAAARVVLEMSDRLIGWDACWLELCNAEGREARTVLLMDEIDGRRTEVPAPCDDLLASSLAQRAIDEGPFLILRRPEELPGAELPFGDTSRPSASYLCVPIRSGDRVIGAMSIQSYTLDAYDDDDLETFQALADYCVGALERTQAEAAHQQLQEQLVQAQKMQAVGRLAGGIAHDFNNMLAVINGYTTLLLGHPETAASLRPSLEETRKAGERAAALTRQLLAFSRKQIIQPQVLRLHEVVASTEQMLRRLIGEDIELVTRTHPSVGLVKADPSQLEQVLVNLVVNARDAMPQGGRLTIDLQQVELTPRATDRGPDRQPGGYVCLQVTDTGCGMEPEVLAHIFEPFFTTKPVGQGTGLGLATVYGIVKQSGGHIEIDSAPGKGTVFRIYLPCLDEPQLEPAVTESGHSPCGSETILVVEDEEMLRRLVCNILRMNGYQVLEAGNADEALLRCQEHRGAIDLLLTDVVMPGRNGRELAVFTAARYPQLKVIYMSGYTDDAVVRHGVSATEVHFLQKPFTTATLIQKMREVLD